MHRALVSKPPVSCVCFRGTVARYSSTHPRTAACISSGYGSEQQADAVILLSFAMLFFFYSGTDCMVDFSRSCRSPNPETRNWQSIPDADPENSVICVL